MGEWLIALWGVALAFQAWRFAARASDAELLAAKRRSFMFACASVVMASSMWVAEKYADAIPLLSIAVAILGVVVFSAAIFYSVVGIVLFFSRRAHHSILLSGFLGVFSYVGLVIVLRS